MIRNKYTYIAFLIFSSQSLNASSIENNISLNNSENNKEQEKYDDNFDFAKRNLLWSVSELHNKIINEGKKKEFIDPVIESFSAFSQFLLDQKDKFKCSGDITKLADFITNKIVEPFKEKEQDEIISAFICNMSADLNAFSENLYSLQQGKEDCKSLFYSFLCNLLNKKEINGVSVEVDLLTGKRQHFNITINNKRGVKENLDNLFVKVLKNKDEVVNCTKWNSQPINIDEKDNSLSTLLGKKNSFSICFPKDLDPSELNVVIYNSEEGNDISFSF